MKPRTTKESRDSRRLQRAAASLAAAPKSYALGAMPGILPFQKEWLARAFASDIDLAGLSAARGCGKSTLAGWVAACAVAPQGALHEPQGAVLIVAPTTSQGREVLLAARHFLEGVDNLRWRDSASSIGVKHLPTASECRILAASSKSLLGYGAHAGVIVFDEVGAAGAKGRAVFDALITGLGKRQGQRLVALGTRSPSGPGIGGRAGWPPRRDSQERISKFWTAMRPTGATPAKRSGRILWPVPSLCDQCWAVNEPRRNPTQPPLPGTVLIG